ncbi:MAG TPA: putative toxin-antitoxin system toxin component, PIN family [Dehalococcoidia bacterium]|nr:putative toxin-antitoxin system toxin component, PIN family [Dehalococcoidia bacterium]
MRAVIDTNVVVSGLIRESSTPGRVLAAWMERRFTIVTSEPLLEELERVLGYSRIFKHLGWDDERRVAYISRLRQRAEIVRPVRRLTVVSDDPDDDRVIEAAVAGRADYIVSGDAHLLTVQRFEAVQIVTPAAFLPVLDAD